MIEKYNTCKIGLFITRHSLEINFPLTHIQTFVKGGSIVATKVSKTTKPKKLFYLMCV